MTLGPVKVGNLPTFNWDDYPGLGDWFVQLRIGPTNDEVLARVYGNSPEQADERARLLAHALSPSVDELPEQSVTVVTGEMIEALQRIEETAMRWTLVARIPECGEFAGIAQDAGWLLDALKVSMGQEADQ